MASTSATSSGVSAPNRVSMSRVCTAAIRRLSERPARVRSTEHDATVRLTMMSFNETVLDEAPDDAVYAIYGPPEHPEGTVHATKADSDADEHHH